MLYLNAAKSKCIQIAKGFNMFGYMLFFVTTIPMCVATVAKLEMDRKKIVRAIVS